MDGSELFSKVLRKVVLGKTRCKIMAASVFYRQGDHK